MQNHLLTIAESVMLLPLLGAVLAGVFGKQLGRNGAHRVTVSLIAIAFFLSVYLVYAVVWQNQPAVSGDLYTWVVSGRAHFAIGILLDRLSAVMVCIVSFISLAVHIYTIGYMADDDGYQRFFSYVSLFTFAMFTLVLANSFLLMFFGWEGVGFVSYLLIGFWFGRDSAVFGSLKAFIVNRVGDVGFILALAAILLMFGSLDYGIVFPHAASVANQTIRVLPGVTVPALGLISVLLFIGAMAKSAQVPLHVWLPESMEGPTPISALIHAATMVTAGIYMIARCSWLFEYSPHTLSLILVLGGTTAFFMGILAINQTDIKRVIAYSTISQLGYMAVGLGASAYDAAIFHLVTHAFFKALLFLAAGSVILALHHEQDMRKMGGLARRLPITCFTFIVGALALSALPPFAGFYSKDAIIEAVHLSTTPGAHYAYYCVLAGAFLTPLYIFRAVWLTFYGTYRGEHDVGHVKESPWVVTFPLVLLAIPSVIAGYILAAPMLYDAPRLLGNSIFVLPQHAIYGEMVSSWPGAWQAALAAIHAPTFWLVIVGIIFSWLITMTLPRSGEFFKKRFRLLAWMIDNKYGFDALNQHILARGARALGRFFYTISDLILIDGIFVNGSGRGIRWLARVSRRLQTGHLYHYAFAMVAGLAILLLWLLW